MWYNVVLYGPLWDLRYIGPRWDLRVLVDLRRLICSRVVLIWYLVFLFVLRRSYMDHIGSYVDLIMLHIRISILELGNESQPENRVSCSCRALRAKLCASHSLHLALAPDPRPPLFFSSSVMPR